MSTSWKTRVVKIGNSQGIRIPKLLLEHAGISDEVEVEVQANQLIIRPTQSPRQGWEEQFQAMAEAGDDSLLDAEPLILAKWEANNWDFVASSSRNKFQSRRKSCSSGDANAKYLRRKNERQR